MDPRRAPRKTSHNPNAEQNKRHASRSPDNPIARKLSKPTPNGTSFTTGVNDASRRSSVSNAQGNQTNATTRNDSSSLFVKSPDSIDSRRSGSRYEDATSGRSTPLSASGVITRPGMPPVPPMANGTIAAAATNSVVETLMKFSNQVTRLATINIAKEQAETRKRLADTEFDNTKDHHRSFPAIAEQKRRAVEKAKRNLKAIDDELADQTIVQQQLARDLAGLIGQTAEVNPAGSRDLSRAADDILPELERRISDMEKRVTDITSHVTVTKQHEMDIDKDLANVNKRVADIDTRVTDVDKRAINRAQNADGRLKKVLESAETINTRVANLEHRLNKLTALETRLQKLEGPAVSATGTSNDVRRVERVTDELKKQLDKLTRDFEQQIADGRDTIDKLKPDIEMLTATVIGMKDEALETPVDDRSSLVKKHLKIQEQLEAIVGDITDLKEDVQENGKGSVVKRLRNLDFLVNNLNTQIQNPSGPPLKQRLSQLENDYTGLEADLKALKDKSTLQSDVHTAAGQDSKAIFARIEALGEELREDVDSRAAEKDDLTLKHIDASVANFQSQLSAFEDRVKSGEQTLKASTLHITDSVTELKDKLGQLEKDAVRTTTLNGTLSAMREDIQKVMAFAAAREKPTPTPPTPNLNVPGLANGAVRSPQLNGARQQNNGSPLANGTPPPVIPASMQSAIDKLAAKQESQDQEFQTLTKKNDALTVVTHHLQIQYNNLTTDEVCQAMLDQLAKIWPHAKNWETSIRDFNNVIAAASGKTDNTMRVASEAKLAAEKANHSAMTAMSKVETLKALCEGVNDKLAGYEEGKRLLRELQVQTKVLEETFVDEMRHIKDLLEK